MLYRTSVSVDYFHQQNVCARQISKNPQKQRGLGDCGGVTVLLEMCDPAQNTEATLLVPVLWGLRNCLHGNAPNKGRFLRAGGLETLVEARHPKK